MPYTDTNDQALSIQITLPYLTCSKILLCLFTRCVSIILDCSLDIFILNGLDAKVFLVGMTLENNFDMTL